MARWKLIEAHYLNVPGTTWEAKEVDRSTGRQVKKVFNVPLYLDPKDEADWNYRREQDPDLQDGGIIVCLAGKGRPRDIVFEGDPTPCMIPLDDEATKISLGFHWRDAVKDYVDDPDLVQPTYMEKKLIALQSEVAQKSSTTKLELPEEFMELLRGQQAILAALAKTATERRI